MAFLHRVLDLIASNGISKNKLLTDIHINKNSFVDWDKNKTIPGGDVVAKIADYFHVSTDYLLGRTDDPSPMGEEKAPIPISEGELNETAQRFMPLVDKLTPEQQQLLLAQLQAWTGQNGWPSPAAPNLGGGTTHGSDP